ncbi:hypothetical protein Dimus_036487 [Dionaea muscipula]
MFNQEWRQPRTRVEVAQFEIQIALDAILLAKINDGLQWNMKELIDQGLLMDAGLATVLVAVSSPSSQDCQVSSNPEPSESHPNDPSSSSSGSEEDSDKSSVDSLPPYQHQSTPTPVPLLGEANSSLSNPFYPTVGPNAEAFTWTEDPAGGEGLSWWQFVEDLEE